jgi:hypothetical protein
MIVIGGSKADPPTGNPSAARLPREKGRLSERGGTVIALPDLPAEAALVAPVSSA